jgi:hypothetical protein
MDSSIVRGGARGHDCEQYKQRTYQLRAQWYASGSRQGHEYLRFCKKRDGQRENSSSVLNQKSQVKLQ